MKLTQDIDVNVLVDVSDGVGCVTAVVAGVGLAQVPDCDSFGGHDSVRVVWRFVDRSAVVNPLDFGTRDTIGFTLEHDGFAFSGGLDLRLGQKPGLGQNFQMHRMGLGESDTVGRLAGVLSGVFKINVLDDQSLAVVVVSRSAPGTSTTRLAPPNFRKWSA